MFRLPKTSNQSPSKRVVVISQKNQGLCKYSQRKCNLLCMDNYDYCLKHILEDKSAPYKPCPFVYSVSGKKCGKPAFRPDRKDTWFCATHGRKAHLLRQKASSRRAPPQTQEALLASLSHYARTDHKREGNENGESASKQSSQAINPFVDVDAAQVNARCSQVLDYASDSDSDVEVAMVDTVWRDQNFESSDAESVDSQAEDPLKHAGVYTAEEVTVIMKDKMIRLQSLYIDQFRRLHHLLKERRRKYLHALKKDKETLSSINNQAKHSAKEQKLYQKLKALNHFHKYFGEEAVLHKKALERRIQVTEGTAARTSHKGKCAFTEGGVKCGAKTLPVTKYCQKHILQDTQQVLFRACGFKRDDHTCKEPTANVFENATCVYHITLPGQPHNNVDMPEIKEEIFSDQESQDDTVAETKPMAVVKQEISAQEVTLKPVESVSSRTPVEPTLKSSKLVTFVHTPAMENVTKTMPVSTNVMNNVDEKMDLGNNVVDSSNEELPKQESSADDLVMVDMMTDVGVVEEVLESEVKSEPEESMQLGLEDSLGSG